MLANLLGSRLRAKVLGWLFSHPDEKYYQANRDCAVFPELCGLALKTAGMADVLREELSGDT